MTLVKAGVVGAIVAVICCFTPVLVALFTTLGIAWLIGYMDYLLLPLLAIFVVILVILVMLVMAVIGFMKSHSTRSVSS